MKYIYWFLIILPTWGHAQVLQDDFTDGDFSNNPTWLGDVTDYRVNTSLELQLDAQGSSPAQLYTTATLADSVMWEFYLRLDFAPSGSNRAKIYLQADQPDLTASLNGYFLQVGESGNNDALEIYRQTGNATQLLLRATDGAMANAPATARIQVIRDGNGDWAMYTDYTGGSNYVLQGTFSDNTHAQGGYFGLVSEFTSTRSDLFFYDDFSVGPLFQDVTPPTLDSAWVTNATTLALLLSEPIAPTSLAAATCTIPTVGAATSLSLDPTNSRILRATLPQGLTSENLYTVQLAGVTDAAGNVLVPGATAAFTYYAFRMPQPGMLLINEIMADPTPAVGLPEVEYVELYNASTDYILLSDVAFVNSVIRIPLPSVPLAPGGYVIICSSAAEPLLRPFGECVPLPNFLPLVNTGDDLYLEAIPYYPLHAVTYTDEWYADPTRSDGGYSLELINPTRLCLGAANWQASPSPTGGTPGQQNAAFDPTPDGVAPTLIATQAPAADRVQLTFDEPLDATTATQPSLYRVGSIIPVTVQLTAPDAVTLLLATPLTDGATYTVTATGVADCAGNAAGAQSLDVTYYATVRAAPFGVLITEIMADPTPPLGLPELEYIELYNRSTQAVNLLDYALEVDNRVAFLPAYVLLPDARVTLHPRSILEQFEAEVATLPLDDFPALSNGGATIRLRNDLGELLDRVAYTSAWYGDAGKSDGGFALEMVSTDNYCVGATNWRASHSPKGGTPSAPNSVAEPIRDTQPPRAVRAFPVTPTLVRVFFGERLDVGSAETVTQYGLSANASLPINTATVVDESAMAVDLTLGAPLVLGERYTLTIAASLADCQGNVSVSNQSLAVALPEVPAVGDVLINEVLFDPVAGGSDYVELYNASDKVVNLGDCNLGRWEGGQLQGFEAIATDVLLFPGGYAVITPDVLTTQAHYIEPLEASPALGLWVENELPTLPDDAGGIALLYDGTALDALVYASDWHHPLLADEEGVSLERLRWEAPTQSRDNWQSAPAVVQYGTPSYENAQRVDEAMVSTGFSLAYETFSPDDDGYRDVLLLDYALDVTDVVARVRVYDREGRLVRDLLNNVLLGTRGTVKWDGATDAGTRARMGVYVVLVETTRPDGSVARERLQAVLAQRLD